MLALSLRSEMATFITFISMIHSVDFARLYT